MQRIQGWSERGNTKVSVGGQTSTTVVQGSYPLCTITVYITGTVTLASLFSDDNVSPTPLANPFTSLANGAFGFFVANGGYDIVFSGVGIITPFTLSDVQAGLGNSGIPSYAVANLPASKTQDAGNLARVLDKIRGLWMDTGTQWFKTEGDFIDAKEFGVQPNVAADQSIAAQAALDASMAAGGVPVRFPAGTIQINNTLTWYGTTDGPAPIILGMGRFATVFDNRVANGPLFDIKSSVLNKFIRGGLLQDFRIITTTSPVVSDGIWIKALYQVFIRNVQITGMSGSGISINLVTGDSDGPVEIIAENCWVETCGGYGITCNTTGLHTEISWLILKGCYIIQNFLGGVRVRCLGFIADHTAFTLNSPTASIGNGGVGGVQVAYDIAGGVVRDILFRQCGFENNGICHLDIQAAVNVRVEQCDFLHALIAAPGNVIANGIKMGNSGIPGAAIVNCLIEQAFVRNNTPGFTQYNIGPDSIYTVIKDTRWDVFNPATQVQYSDGGFQTRVRDVGFDWPSTDSYLNTALNAGDSYIPIATRYSMHRLNLTGIGAYTINAPTLPAVGIIEGTRIYFEIYNSSGGEVTVTWNAIFKISGFYPPANGEHRSVWLVYDNAIGWMQLGGWNIQSRKVTISKAAADYSANPILANTVAGFTVTVPGAAIGDSVVAIPGASPGAATLVWSAFVSAADTVTVKVANVTTGNIAPSTVNWTVTVSKA